MTTIQQQLRARREALGLTQAELATQLGWSQSRIADLEAGRRSPTLDTLTEWCVALGMEVHVRPSKRARETHYTS